MNNGSVIIISESFSITEVNKGINKFVILLKYSEMDTLLESSAVNTLSDPPNFSLSIFLLDRFIIKDITSGRINFVIFPKSNPLLSSMIKRFITGENIVIESFI